MAAGSERPRRPTRGFFLGQYDILKDESQEILVSRKTRSLYLSPIAPPPFSSGGIHTYRIKKKQKKSIFITAQLLRKTNL